jgi:hypothetical protein
MGSLSLKKKISTSLTTKTGGIYYIIFKGPAGTTFGSFFNPGIAAVVNSGGAYNFYFNGDLNNPTTYYTDGGDWYDGSFNIATNNIIPIDTILQIESDFLDYVIDFGGNIQNYFGGKTSIKKQNLTKLKSGSFYSSEESYYIFKSAINNTLGQIFNPSQFEPYSDTLSIYDSNFNFIDSFFSDGVNWLYSDFTTIADGYVFSIDTVLVFGTSFNFDINVNGGAIIQKYYSGKINLNLYYPDDSDARNYILAVEAVEGPLEVGVKKAINNFIVGCKSDGIWTAIKASCLLAGPKTLNGILVPLVGTAPTNINFISSDYNRKTGLKGDGSTKYLDSNRSNSADPQNSKHVSAYLTESPTRDATRSMIAVDTASSNLFLGTSIASVFFRINPEFLTPTSFVDSNLILGLFGGSRNLSSNVNTRYNQNNGTLANTSINPSSTNIYIFSRQTLTNYSNARITFYSIGENIDLEKLENRVKTYVDTLSTLPI